VHAALVLPLDISLDAATHQQHRLAANSRQAPLLLRSCWRRDGGVGGVMKIAARSTASVGVAEHQRIGVVAGYAASAGGDSGRT